MSRIYRAEKREKFTTAAGFLAAVVLSAVLAASRIGDLPAAERGNAWLQFSIALVAVGVPVSIFMWRLTPFKESSEEEKRLDWGVLLPIVGVGIVISNVLRGVTSAVIVFLGGAAGFFLSLAAVFVLVGALGRWRSKDLTRQGTSEPV